MKRETFLFTGLAALGAVLFWAMSPTLAQDATNVETRMADPENMLTIQLESGDVIIQMLPDVAPRHVERIRTLAEEGAYDGVVFHRVIEGFMAQTGDVEHGRGDGDLRRAGTGGSQYPDLPAEFSNVPFDRGAVGMARAQNPNSANSQFFIMFQPAPHLNGQYTVWGQVVSGMEHVDAIRRGNGPNGSVSDPDQMITVRVGAPE
ncbi:MAG: peptidylprolyl isomerase [Rubricella sp.]